MMKRIKLALLIVNILFLISSCADKFEVDPLPDADFVLANDTVYVGDTINLSVANPIEGCYYYWNYVGNQEYSYNYIRSKEGSVLSIPTNSPGSYIIQLSAINDGGLKQIEKTVVVIYRPLPQYSFSGTISNTNSYKITRCEFYINDDYYSSNLLKTSYFSGLNTSENYSFTANLNPFYTNEDPQTTFNLVARIYYSLGSNIYVVAPYYTFNVSAPIQTHNFNF